jgi:hypothetical protein
MRRVAKDLGMYVCDHEKKRSSLRITSDPLPSTLPFSGGLCNLPSTSSSEGGINTGAALGQDGSYILALDRLPGTGRPPEPHPGLLFHTWHPFPSLASPAWKQTSYTAKRPCLWARPGWAETCIHPYGRDSSCCCCNWGIGWLRVLRVVQSSVWLGFSF